MKFYNRVDELAHLDGLNDKRPTFIVLTGKRRIGKTELIKQFMTNKDALYLFVDDKKSSQILLEEYEEYIRSQLGLPDYIRFGTFGEMFQFLIGYEKDLVVAIDEFQRFMKLDPSIFSQLQKQWDMKKVDAGSFLITSGSSIGMMKKIFIENRAPLFKRADNIISLRPFTLKIIFQILDDMGIRDKKEKLNFYSLFGGTIFYYRIMEKYGVTSFEQALDKLILSDLAPLRNEVRDILIEEFGKKHSTYFEILSALAMGKNTKKEIGDMTHVSATSLAPYLYDLKELLQIVEYIVPVTEDPKRTKKGRYILSDNFFSFYFRFIFRNMSLYEIGAYETIRKKILTNWRTFQGQVFEHIAMRSIKTDLLTEYPNVGSYWDRKGHEFDIVGINRKTREMMIVEVKVKDINLAQAEGIIDSLEQRSNQIPYRAKRVRFGIVARNIEGKRRLKQNGYSVWDLKDLEGLHH